MTHTVAARGALHTRNARSLRETGQHPYVHGVSNLHPRRGHRSPEADREVRATHIYQRHINIWCKQPARRVKWRGTTGQVA